MTFMTGLQCHLCGAKYPAEALWVCGECLGPLEVVYDYAGAREAMTREVAARRWYEEEFAPVSGLIEEGALVRRGETQADAYLRVARERYSVFLEHVWSPEVIDTLRRRG